MTAPSAIAPVRSSPLRSVVCRHEPASSAAGTEWPELPAKAGTRSANVSVSGLSKNEAALP